MTSENMEAETTASDVVLNRLEAVKLKIRKSVEQRVAVVEFGMNKSGATVQAVCQEMNGYGVGYECDESSCR